MCEPEAPGPGSTAPDNSKPDSSKPDTSEPDHPEPQPTPLLHPAEGIPDLSVTVRQIQEAAKLLGRGRGPFAVDAERASGFRYSNRAYLIQIRRAGAGTVLIDPVSHGADPLEALRPVAEVLSEDEWILHSADQDLPCLAEVGLRPPALYDTELAGRLAGFERVNLATMVERLLGSGLAKGHGAADWSKRPLPEEWLNYAALDVELLIELRAAIAEVLAQQGKTDWAAEEFDYLRAVGSRDPSATGRPDRWRRTSGIHRVRDQRALAAVRELWLTRDRIAQRRDIAPRRILPDSAIIEAALADPKTIEDLTALPVFGGRNQRRSAATWLGALEAARQTKNPPADAEPPNGPPPPARWSRRKPEAAARLEAARAALSRVSEEVHVPTENLVSPDLVRRLCWDWEPAPDPLDAVETFLRAGQARRWQRELVDPPLAQALQPPESTETGD
ncbi:3'-5' exonuclease [Mycobacterium scrofulaceum]|uniref:HRDC domain-containing protein n=1 Tax=Mycobacterium scrofulaceum TaxID=1783 RepID=UPI0007FDA051|nr:ribonuclease D [Mycobacterium scrofulaceum]OBH86964.1 3'-5' exonuclease [Mycobacterium scrofulaceum]